MAASQPESLYGSVKMWAHLNRQGIKVAKCTVERLMRRNGWEGVRRSQEDPHHHARPRHDRAPDLVKRQFRAPAPNRLLVADFTYVRMATGCFAYTAFVIDAYAEPDRRLGMLHLETDRVRGVRDPPSRRPRAGRATRGQLVHHSDAGSQGGIKWSSQHLEMEVCVGGTAAFQDGAGCGRSTAVGSGSGVAAADAFTGAAGAIAVGAACVLAVDRCRCDHRGRRSDCGCVDTGRHEMVPPRWRDATDQSGRAHRPLPVLRRA